MHSGRQVSLQNCLGGVLYYRRTVAFGGSGELFTLRRGLLVCLLQSFFILCLHSLKLRLRLLTRLFGAQLDQLFASCLACATVCSD